MLGVFVLVGVGVGVFEVGVLVGVLVGVRVGVGVYVGVGVGDIVQSNTWKVSHPSASIIFIIRGFSSDNSFGIKSSKEVGGTANKISDTK
jgi:hypothetical protein